MFDLPAFDPLILAYVAIITMAVAPIALGAYRSVPSSKKKNEKEIMSSKDAYLAPILGSVALFSLYLLVKYVSKAVINLIITGYITFFGSVCLIQLTTPHVRSFYKWIFKLNHDTSGAENAHHAEQKEDNEKKPSPSVFGLIISPVEIKVTIGNTEVISFSFDVLDVLSIICVSAFAAYYILYKGWIASNIYGEAICFGAISLIHLDSFITGSILLSGLFLYDIFWVFGTDVMVTVAQSFDAPLLLRFPRNIFDTSSQWTMLGLGDIVIPGIFVSLCLRYDHERAGKPDSFAFKKPYFTTCLIAYILGLVTTIVVMHTFKAAQPALLYLSPACILSVVLTGVVQADLINVIKYSSLSDEEKKLDTGEQQSAGDQKAE